MPPLAIPATLHDSLMARLDRLATAKTVAQLGATIGRTFTYDLLQAVARWTRPRCTSALRQLVDAEFVYQRGVPPQATYTFKHALIQDAAYQSLLGVRASSTTSALRRYWRSGSPRQQKRHPELLAHHQTEASLGEPAVDDWQRAGESAEKRSANVEAIAHLTKGLEVLNTLPETPTRAQHELLLHLALGTPLAMAQGWAAPEVGKAYSRALELSRRVGDLPQPFPGLLGLWRFYILRAEFQTAHELGEQLLTFARRGDDPVSSLVAHVAQGITLFYRGAFTQARVHLEQAVALYDLRQHRALAYRFGEDLGVACLAHAALALWVLGYADQALHRIQEALALGQALLHPHSLALALLLATWYHHSHREGQTALEQAPAGIELAQEHGFPHILSPVHGLVRLGHGQTGSDRREGIAQMRQSLAALRATGIELGQSYYPHPLRRGVWPWRAS